MQPTRRKQRHDSTRLEIKTLAWKQIDRGGLPALSLGRIAGEMGLTTPALYRYFPGRDELVADLIRESYESLAKTLEIARNGAAPADHASQFLAACLAYHAWAITHPQQYQLIFNSPLPADQIKADAEQAAACCFRILLEIIDSAEKSGAIRLSTDQLKISPNLEARLSTSPQTGEFYSARDLYLALISWSFIHGLTSLELNKRYTPILGDRTGEFIRLEIRRFMRTIGFD
jgi:AcrR family transcriptional regulator